MDDIALSFCIPTYNGAQRIHELVTGILKCDAPDIEVVVSDNGSTDDTLSRLRAIQDERLVVLSNGENKGSQFNSMNVLDKGRGKFVLLSMDKDRIDPGEIRDFKSFLLGHPDVAGGFCQPSDRSTADFELVPRGSRAVKEIGYKARHPTGYFFNNALLKSVDLVGRFSKIRSYPFDFAMAELCLLGDGAIYRKPLCLLLSVAAAAKQKSFEQDGNSKDAHFSPQSQLRMALDCARHANTLKLSAPEKESLIVDKFIQQLLSATLGYRAILQSPEMCAYYHRNTRNVGSFEMLTIAWDFYRQFLKSARNPEAGDPLVSNTFSARVLIRLIEKSIKRIFRRKDTTA